jgi:hypothetical protein
VETCQRLSQPSPCKSVAGILLQASRRPSLASVLPAAGQENQNKKQDNQQHQVQSNIKTNQRRCKSTKKRKQRGTVAQAPAQAQNTNTMLESQAQGRRHKHVHQHKCKAEAQRIMHNRRFMLQKPNSLLRGGSLLDVCKEMLATRGLQESCNPPPATIKPPHASTESSGRPPPELLSLTSACTPLARLLLLQASCKPPLASVFPATGHEGKRKPTRYRVKVKIHDVLNPESPNTKDNAQGF